MAALSSTQFGGLPQPPGKTPIPEGHDRYFHQTSAENLDAIKEQGLRYDKGRGIEGPKGVWVSNKPFYSTSRAPMIEMALPHDPARGHVASIGDVSPDKFVAVHEPWHDHARYMLNDPKVRHAVMAGEHDNLLSDPDYGPAVRHVKATRGPKET